MSLDSDVSVQLDRTGRKLILWRVTATAIAITLLALIVNIFAAVVSD
jgi:hypothetical protein